MQPNNNIKLSPFFTNQQEDCDDCCEDCCECEDDVEEDEEELCICEDETIEEIIDLYVDMIANVEDINELNYCVERLFSEAFQYGFRESMRADIDIKVKTLLDMKYGK